MSGTESHTGSKQDSGVEGLIASKLLESRTIMLSGEIGDRQAHLINGQLLVLNGEDPDAPIDLIINSGGGAISSGFAIYDTIRMIKAPVRTIGAGLVASMGVTIYLSVPKERRASLPNTRYMIHQPLIAGTVVAPASDLEINAREMVKLRERLNQLIAEATEQPLEKVEHDTLRDFWLTASGAADYGIVGQVIHSLDDLAQ